MYPDSTFSAPSANDTTPAERFAAVYRRRMAGRNALTCFTSGHTLCDSVGAPNDQLIGPTALRRARCVVPGTCTASRRHSLPTSPPVSAVTAGTTLRTHTMSSAWWSDLTNQWPSSPGPLAGAASFASDTCRRSQPASRPPTTPPTTPLTPSPICPVRSVGSATPTVNAWSVQTRSTDAPHLTLLISSRT